jgi:hypothetical protein
MLACIPTTTSTPYPTITPTPTPTGCNPANANCVYPTLTPFAYNAVNTLVVHPVDVIIDVCFGFPNGGLGCGELVDQSFSAHPSYPHGAGQALDVIIDSGHLVAAVQWPEFHVTPYGVTYTVLVILIVIPVVPPFP